MFPSWFAGGLVPAAIMSIAAANLWTHNVYRAFLKPDATPAQEARQAQLMSLVVKFGALFFVVWLPRSSPLNLQLLGGIWILPTFPSIVFGLYTGWFHRWALLAGCAAGMAYGTWAAYLQPAIGRPNPHFGSPLAVLPFAAEAKGYIALTAFTINVAVGVMLTVVLRRSAVDPGLDETEPADYVGDAGDPRVAPLPPIGPHPGWAPGGG
jgi:SSS family solute:Na+ symporter